MGGLFEPISQHAELLVVTILLIAAILFAIGGITAALVEYMRFYSRKENILYAPMTADPNWGKIRLNPNGGRRTWTDNTTDQP
jgi:hypothetical protein